MSVWLIAAALAAPPDGVLPEEVGQWAPYWSSIQDGPSGCWEVTGAASWDWDLGRFGITKGGAAFVGRMEDGVWQDFAIRSLGETNERPGTPPVRFYPHESMHFAPMVGRLSPEIFDQDRLEDNILEQMLDTLGGPVTTTWSEWNEARQGILLHRSVPVGSGERAEGMLTVLFPDAGTLPTELDLTLDQSFALPDHPAVRIRSGEVHVRGRVVEGQTWPSSEAFSFAASVFGYRVWGAQTIRYQAFRPCGGASELEAAPLIP